MSPKPCPNGSPGMFGDISSRYDLLNRVISLGLDVLWRKKAATLCRGRVLDACCGTGDMAAAIESAGLDVVASDASWEMLNRARQRHPDMNLVLADAQKLCFQDESFDTVSMAWGLRNLPDKKAGLTEAFRVLKPGGRIVVLDSCTPENPTRPFFRFYTHGLVPLMAALFGADPGAYKYLARSIDSFGPRSEIKAMFQRAGFERVRVIDLNFGLAVLITGEKPIGKGQP